MSRTTNQQIAQGFAQGLQNFTQGYIKRKDQEAAKLVLEDPKSTPVQKALAWEKMSEGSGPKVYDTILKEQALKKQEENDASVMQDLFPNQAKQQDAGQRAGVGTITPSDNVPQGKLSPVQLAQQQQQAFPGYQNFQQAPNQQQVPDEQVQQEQAPQEQENAPEQPKRNISNIPTVELQNLLGRTKNKDIQKVIQSELNNRNVDKKADAKIDAARRSANKDFRNKVVGGVKNSKKMDFQLDEMEQLNEEGVEVSPLGYTALKMAGVPLSAFFEAPNAEAMQKLSMDTTTGAVRDYGNRLFASEFKVFLERIPELWQSQEGRRRVIKTMRLYNDLEKVEQDAYMDLYNYQKSQGIKSPIVDQEDVVQLSGQREDELISQLNTDLASERQIRDLGEVGKNKTLVKFPDGNIYPVPNGELKEALQWGEVVTR